MYKLKFLFVCFIAGFLNTAFGSGGGIFAIKNLEKAGFESKKAHALSLVVIFPLSIISSFLYFYNGNLNLKEASIIVMFSIPGALIGTKILKKINNIFLKRFFGILILYSSLKMLFNF